MCSFLCTAGSLIVVAAAVAQVRQIRAVTSKKAKRIAVTVVATTTVTAQLWDFGVPVDSMDFRRPSALWSKLARYPARTRPGRRRAIPQPRDAERPDRRRPDLDRRRARPDPDRRLRAYEVRRGLTTDRECDRGTMATLIAPRFRCGLGHSRLASSVTDDTDRSQGLVATPAPGMPGPCSSGLEMNAAARPALRAAARSASCAAASMTSPG
jgi:hypothetical protein